MIVADRDVDVDLRLLAGGDLHGDARRLHRHAKLDCCIADRACVPSPTLVIVNVPSSSVCAMRICVPPPFGVSLIGRVARRACPCDVDLAADGAEAAERERDRRRIVGAGGDRDRVRAAARRGARRSAFVALLRDADQRELAVLIGRSPTCRRTSLRRSPFGLRRPAPRRSCRRS